MAWMNLSEGLVKIIELLLYDRFSYVSEGIPLSVKKLSFRKKINLFRCGINKLFSTAFASGYPPVIQVEPSNICNLTCHLCPSGEGNMKREKGIMSAGTFQKILDEIGDTLITVSLYSWGEPFLNRELPEMLSACTDRNILTTTSTNGHFIQTLEEALNIVDAGLKGLTIAIDGSTQDIYENFRRGGKLEKVKNCSLLIEKAKSIRGSKFPYTNIRAVVMRQNQEDIQNIENLARSIGVNMFSYKSLASLNHSPEVKKLEPTDKKLYKYKYEPVETGNKKLIKCIFPFRQPTVFWDGTVVGCEMDYDLEIPLGKMGEEKFSNIWNSPRAIKLRKSILQNGLNHPDFCHRCCYRETVNGNTVLSYKELNPVRP